MAGRQRPDEIKNLLGIVERGLADSKVEAVSTDLRFIAVLSAALTAATTALRASGHRTATQAGHHIKTIESLELTVKASLKLIQRFKDLQQQEKLRHCRRRIRPGIGSNGKARERTEGQSDSFFLLLRGRHTTICTLTKGSPSIQRQSSSQPRLDPR
jgi:hypothetical protein